MLKYVDQNGNIYEGDMRPGDRIATEEEINAFLDQIKIIPDISDRQFFQQLCIDKLITEEEALASNAAVIPSAILTLINNLPEEMRFPAKMLISGATVFERNHPMTTTLGAMLNWSDDQLDNFFMKASQL